MERSSSGIRGINRVKDVVGSFRLTFLTRKANKTFEIKTDGERPTYDLSQSSEFYKEDSLEEMEDRNTFLDD